MKASETKILAAANDLFREYGYNGTSMKQVVAASDLPTGSVYHFYSGGKVELAAAVVVQAGGAYQQLIEDLIDGYPDLLTGFQQVFEEGANLLASTNYIDPCPIGGIAREVASVEPRLRKACDAAFSGWIESAARRLEHGGLDVQDAVDMAVMFVAAVEGGFLLSRSARDPEPMRAAGRAFCKALQLQVAAT